jgi:hypothetical protein
VREDRAAILSYKAQPAERAYDEKEENFLGVSEDSTLSRTRRTSSDR